MCNVHVYFFLLTDTATFWNKDNAYMHLGILNRV